MVLKMQMWMVLMCNLVCVLANEEDKKEGNWFSRTFNSILDSILKATMGVVALIVGIILLQTFVENRKAENERRAKKDEKVNAIVVKEAALDAKGYETRMQPYVSPYANPRRS